MNKKIISSPQKPTRVNASILHDRSFILNDKTPFSVIEEYKTLRTNIMFSIPVEGCKIIGVTSPQPMDGKSITCLNLAITVAQTKARVLLIDGDLRLPKIARLLDAEAIPGLSNVLVGLSTLNDAVMITSNSGLHTLFSGDIPPNPSELLGSANMGRMLEELKTRYDYIFIDLPPINVVSDAVAISKFMSGEILVVRAGLSHRENLTRAINQLEFVDANILGVVLNGIQTKPGGRLGRYGKLGKYGRYKEYGQYGRYKESDKNNKNVIIKPKSDYKNQLVINRYESAFNEARKSDK
ncbi:MAG: polysaccharide biosynthesis tyrosine autokinase [Clostridia bacterium]|nr:polysaccharide biosynthesis tyrosine autokinase [Clostridia bacterium]